MPATFPQTAFISSKLWKEYRRKTAQKGEISSQVKKRERNKSLLGGASHWHRKLKTNGELRS